ncbi:hypothetical protein L0156_26745 [bacterium]|nr:hypothetical protein [bacterium]
MKPTNGRWNWSRQMRMWSAAHLCWHSRTFGRFNDAITLARRETDKAFEWLERAYKQRDGGLSTMKGDPLLRNLERDPRYRAFLQKMKLPLD